MPQRSPKLDMPYLQPSQAQKHVTHNEALQQLDALVQLSVIAFDATTPPATPTQGDTYVLGTGATGDWAGQDDKIAYRTETGWFFLTPQEGWRAWGQSEGALRAFHSGTWIIPAITTLGVNTTADTTNRLAVAADAVLLSHDGNGHQLKINKATTGDTASLLYQSGWTSHAEIGLAGDNDLSVKTSLDGTTWTEALRVDGTSGHVSGAAVQSSTTDTTAGRLMRADYGYGPGNLIGTVSETAGVPSGSVVERGSNSDGEYVRWADGTQICWGTSTYADVDITNATGGAHRSGLFTENFPVSFSSTPRVTAEGTSTSGDLDVWVVITGSNTTQFSYLHMKINSDSAQSRRLSYIATGRWFE